MRREGSSDLRTRIKALADRALAEAADIAVMVVANLKEERTTSGPYDRQSEYLSESEAEQLVNGFREAGFYCDLFVGERDFIDWVSGGGIRHFPKRPVFVYNTAQSGTGLGRKSLIPAFCMLEDIPTLNADAYSVSLARHKFHVQAILRTVGIPVPDTWWYFGDGAWLNDAPPPAGIRVLAKSTYESASLGVASDSAFTTDGEVETRLNALVNALGQPVVVQTFIAGREAETPIIALGHHPLPLEPVGVSLDGERYLGEGFLTFERVYTDAYEFYDMGADESLSDQLKEIAFRAVQTLQLRGFCRVDVRISETGHAFVTDVATTPHLVEHSSYSFAFRQLGFDRRQMLAALLGVGLSGLSLRSRTGDR